MVWEGWNVGSVTIRRVRLNAAGQHTVQSRRHGGDLAGTIVGLLSETPGPDGEPDGVAVSGPLAATTFDLPTIPEPLSIEKALQGLGLSPNIVLSLGGESFVVYCIGDGHVRSMVSSNRCAAGSGEFVLQQFARMGLDLEEGLEQARQGRHITLASRCSVHIKSDATHKLNKGECTPADIAYTLVVDLAAKVRTLIESTAWSRDSILICGGLSQNGLLVEELRRLLPESQIDTIPESAYLEAYGAAIAARGNGRAGRPLTECLRPTRARLFETLTPLSEALPRVTRIAEGPPLAAQPGMKVLLGVDAGSTTTKAVLLESTSGRWIAASYLRTHGNPVRATGECLDAIRAQIGDCPVQIAQVAVTGSGRELVSVALNNCLSFNEILAHARAARDAHPEVDTIFEIGGQDAKFVSLLKGIPVDYAMNDGCSAGTGSFLEEAAASDMKYRAEEIGPLALQAAAPLAFGERCAAFINSEIRTALQGGENPRDILAGLVYSIVNNYLSRVVGTRTIGNAILLQGGVALNPAVAPAVAAVSGRDVTVPAHPELMGCIGAALMARDLIDEGKVAPQDLDLRTLANPHVQVEQSFRCAACPNRCEIQRIRIGDKTYPFGGLCARWEMQRRPESLRAVAGQDLVSLRAKLMFETFAPSNPETPRGRVGLPLALTTFELYPLYARLLTAWGFEVVLSRPGQGRRNTHAPFCYPGELLHAAVDDVLAQGVDWVFLPQIRQFAIPEGLTHAYPCAFTEDAAGVIRAFFTDAADRILSPEFGLAPNLRAVTESEIVRAAAQMGVDEATARAGLEQALAHQARFEQAYREAGHAALEALQGPVVVLVGRPYVAYNAAANLSLPRKIASRGFHVIPGDLLPLEPPGIERNVWHYTQVTASAIDYAKRHDNTYVAILSCFSCNPDAIIYHRLRYELEGRPFCFLEIDSHTADAGIDTRIGAFLDIVERRRQMEVAPPAVTGVAPRGRIDTAHGTPRIITAEGETLGFDDPRVVHVLIADTPLITSRLFASLYGRKGWRCVIAPFTDSKIMQASRRVCSGRECLPFLSMAGKIVRYLDTRNPNEVTVFHLLECEGPCQIGNWFDAVDIIFQRLGVRNAFPAWPRIDNNYLGGGEGVAIVAATGGVLGDLLGEVRSTLTCTAQDPDAALAQLDAVEDRLVEAARHGIVAVERELCRSARELAAIPLHTKPAERPRVLLFSGINRIFVDKPVRAFFENQGIIAKTQDVGEFLCFYETDPITRRGFAQGRKSPREQAALRTLIAGVFHNPTRQPRFQAAHAALHVKVIEYLDHRWRRIMATTGLTVAPDFHYGELMEAGHAVVPVSGCTEATCTAGRYLLSLREDAFDGYVNIGAFNCLPASSATAATHTAAATSSVPHAVIESDGVALTASQLRQLEAVAAQVWERRGQSAVRI